MDRMASEGIDIAMDDDENSRRKGNAPFNYHKLGEILIHKKFELIRQTYRERYGQDLLDVFATNLKHNPYSRAAYFCMSEPQERDAKLMRNSFMIGNINLNILIEVACTRSSPELLSIKQTYHSLYNCNIEEDIRLKVNTGGFKEILLAVLRSCHNYNGKADKSMAMCDAKTLYEAMESGNYVDKKVILSLISLRNTNQIKLILASYKHLYGREFSKALKKSKCGQFGRELRMVICCVQHPEKFLAKQLRMRIGNDQETLMRIVISRQGNDLQNVNRAFAAKTGSSLESLVRREFNYGNDKINSIVGDFLVGLIRGG